MQDPESVGAGLRPVPLANALPLAKTVPLAKLCR